MCERGSFGSPAFLTTSINGSQSDWAVRLMISDVPAPTKMFSVLTPWRSARASTSRGLPGSGYWWERSMAARAASMAAGGGPKGLRLTETSSKG